MERRARRRWASPDRRLPARQGPACRRLRVPRRLRRHRSPRRRLRVPSRPRPGIPPERPRPHRCAHPRPESRRQHPGPPPRSLPTRPRSESLPSGFRPRKPLPREYPRSIRATLRRLPRSDQPGGLSQSRRAGRTKCKLQRREEFAWQAPLADVRPRPALAGPMNVHYGSRHDPATRNRLFCVEASSSPQLSSATNSNPSANRRVCESQ